MLRPERRRRGDIAAAASIVLLLVVGATLLWRSGDAAGTVSVTAEPPLVAPPAAQVVPAGFVEAWRAPSAATPEPTVAGPAVVSAHGSVVLGRDALTGGVRWSYGRDLPLCTVGAGFPRADDGIGRVLALHASGDWCSEMTALRPDTGARAAQRNPDARPGTRLVSSPGFTALAGDDHVEVVRSDLVETLQYGAVQAPAQPGRQPRSGCTFPSVALAGARVGVLERCPGEATDRFTVLAADGSDGADTPQEEFSVLLPAAGAVLVALSEERAAVALPGPARLLLLDRSGREVGLLPLDVPDADLARSHPVTADAADGRVLWWTGSRTIALDGTELAPVWTLDGTTLGPGTEYAGRLLVPVDAGLAVVDTERGTVERTIDVGRGDADAPVRLASLGEVLLELRGPELVALRPAG
ncbi:MAG TPA: hypothetical protein VM367_08735 [Pseudonocardia sp.]|nr:hypothetical protein [Pseudonocardia sp.]